MRFHRVRMLLGCAAFVAVAAVAYCCGPYGSDSPATLAAGVKVPGQIARSVLQGNALIALLTDGQLVRINLIQGETKNLGSFELPVSGLDVNSGKVCVASKNRAMIVDLADGKITQVGACDHDVSALGFVSHERVYLQSGPQIRVVDRTTGKTVHDFTLGKDDPKLQYRGYRTLGRSGTQLFVSVAREKDAVAVVDLEKGEVVDRISANELHIGSGYEHPTDMLFTGDKAYVLNSRYGYGIWTEKLGVVDLKTRQYTALKLPPQSLQGPSFVAGPDGTVFLTSPNGMFQYDATGKLSAAVVSPNDARRVGIQLLGVWQGKALFSDRQELRQVPMPVATAQTR